MLPLSKNFLSELRNLGVLVEILCSLGEDDEETVKRLTVLLIFVQFYSYRNVYK